MFGGERLARTFGKSAPREWVDMVGNLKDHELQRGLRRMVASGTEHIPAMPKFRRWCQEIAADDDAPQSAPLPQLPSNLLAQDAWEVASNLHLLKHIRTRLRKGHARDYGPVVAFTTGNRDGSPEQQHCTAILVHWKKHWAQMMREEATVEGVDGKYQREQWDAYMRQAEQEIAESVFGTKAA